MPNTKRTATEVVDAIRSSEETPISRYSIFPLLLSVPFGSRANEMLEMLWKFFVIDVSYTDRPSKQHI